MDFCVSLGEPRKREGPVWTDQFQPGVFVFPFTQHEQVAEPRYVHCVQQKVQGPRFCTLEQLSCSLKPGYNLEPGYNQGTIWSLGTTRVQSGAWVQPGYNLEPGCIQGTTWSLGIPRVQPGTWLHGFRVQPGAWVHPGYNLETGYNQGTTWHLGTPEIWVHPGYNLEPGYNCTAPWSKWSFEPACSAEAKQLYRCS